MANAKKCDRCGAYYDTNTEHKIKMSLGVSVHVTGMSLRIPNNDAFDKYDLCDSCIADLKKFMKGETAENA